MQPLATTRRIVDPVPTVGYLCMCRKRLGQGWLMAHLAEGGGVSAWGVLLKPHVPEVLGYSGQCAVPPPCLPALPRPHHHVEGGLLVGFWALDLPIFLLFLQHQRCTDKASSLRVQMPPVHQLQPSWASPVSPVQIEASFPWEN